jgi:iron complex outermembrane receptor protein
MSNRVADAGKSTKSVMTSATAILPTLSALAFGASADSAQAHAQMPEKEIAAIVRNYDIPAGPVSTALNRLADESGARVAYDPRLTRSLTTTGVSGLHTLSEALSRLLSGTGLRYELSENGRSALIVLAQAGRTTSDASAGGATPLPPIDIDAAPQHADSGGRGGAGGAGQGPGDRRTGYKADRAASTLKMDTPLMQTPISVQVVTRQTMDDQQAVTVKDAVVSNVSGVLPQANFFDVFKVRGFSSFGSTYKNGLQEYRLRYLDTTNLQSIEVLKGPAAMLFGRVEPGGAINLVVKRPLETPYVSIEQQVGNFSFTRTTVDATGPVTPDKSILYRFNGEFYSTDSYRNFVSDRATFLAPTITLHPIEQFRMNIDFEYQNRTWVENSELLPAIGDRPANIPVSRYLHPALITRGMPDHFDRKRIAYDWTYDFTPDWSLTNRLSYSSMSTRTLNAVDQGVNQVTGVMTRFMNTNPGYTDRLFSTNLDLKGKFATGPLNHSILIGYDYFNHFTPTYLGYNFFPIAPINIYAPADFQFINIYQNPRWFRVGQRWSGVYAQDMISFLDDSVHVLLGGRYDWAETSNGFNQLTPFDVDRNYKTYYNKAFSPRVGLLVQPLPWLSLYGNFTRSLGANNVTNYQTPLQPQVGEQFEGGVKAELFDNRLTATIAYFDITKTNIPTPDPANANNTLLIGKARSQGVEFDLTGRIDDNWSIIANYTHDDVRTAQGAQAYDPFTLINTQLAVAGKKLPGSPRNYGNLWLKYDADGEFQGLSLGGGVSVYESALGDNANSFITPGYALLNGMIAYSTKIGDATITAQLNVKNITDATYYPSSNSRLQILTGAPRTFLGSLRVEF